MDVIRVMLIISLATILCAFVPLVVTWLHKNKVKKEGKALVRNIVFAQMNSSAPINHCAATSRSTEISGDTVSNTSLSPKFSAEVKKLVKNSGPSLCDDNIRLDMEKARKFSAPNGFFEVRKRELK